MPLMCFDQHELITLHYFQQILNHQNWQSKQLNFSLIQKIPQSKIITELLQLQVPQTKKNTFIASGNC